MPDQINYPNTLSFEEAKIASIQMEYGYGLLSKPYYSVKLAVPVNSRWIEIQLLMTGIELKEMVKKSANSKLRTFIEERFIAPGNYRCLKIKEWLNKYLLCKNLDLDVIQAEGQEIPEEGLNLYTTKGLIEFLR